jgi:hypothetical protein
VGCVSALLGLSLSAHAQLVVQSATPSPNAVAAPRTSNVALTYNQPVATSAAANVRVFSQQAGGRKAATGSVNGNILTVDPIQDFKPGETVFATAPATVLGTSGTAATPYVYQFTTQAGVGPGTFNNRISEVDINKASGGMVMADVDNDGDLDLVATTANAAVVPAYGTNFYSYAATVRRNDGNGNFSGSDVIISTGHYISRVAAGDVDGDGDLDLILAGANPLVGYHSAPAYLLGIHQNNGGSFSKSGGIVQSAFVASIALGDVDGDGDLDLLTANGNTVTIRFNSGTNGFSTSIDVPFAGTTYDVADLLVSQGSTLSVRFNNGKGTFSGGTDSGTDGNLATADVDADGDLDLLVANATSNTVSVRLNDGKGTFSVGTAVPVGSNPYDVVAADVEGDGDLDLVASTQNNTVSVRLNDGTGTFSGTTEVAVGSNPVSLAMGDLDGDLDLDLLTANTASKTVSVRLNQAASATPSLISVSTAPRTGNTVTLTGTNLTGATAVTFNGVAALAFTVDSPTQITATLPAKVTTGLVTITTPQGTTNGVQFNARPLVSAVSPMPNSASSSDNTLYVTYNQLMDESTFTYGVNTFSQQTARIINVGLTGSSTNSSTALLGGNPAFRPGETAFITVRPTPLSIYGLPGVPYVYQFTNRAGVGRGTFSGGSDVSLTNFTGKSTAADVDNDGDLDLLAANQNNTVSVRLNDGKGAFSGGSEVAVRNSPTSLVLGDVDYDGDLDLLTASTSSGTVSVRLNLGKGTFSPTGVEVAAGNSPTNLTLADIDGDGDLDLLATSPSTNTVSIRLNDGKGTFSGSQQVPVGLSPYDVILGDVDSDGDLDLLTANTSGTVSVRFNDSFGTFGAGSETSVGQNPQSLFLNDVDGDSDLDVVTANHDSNTASVRLNDGKGNFSGGSEVAVGSSPAEIALADVDGDRDLDLLTANQGSSSVSVRLNSGKGTFSGSQEVAVGTGALSIALGDLDGDQDLDLLAGNQGSSTVSVRLNQPSSLAPTLLSISGATGPLGNMITLTGTNLQGATAVTINGVVMTSIAPVSPTQLTVTLPPTVTSGPLSVTTPEGTSNSLPFGAPLFVAALLPTRNAVDVPRTTPVSVSFGQSINNSSATVTALRVFSQQGGGRKAGVVSVGNNTVTLTPYAPFKPGETVLATINTAVTPLYPNVAFSVPQTFQFTTATAPATGLFTSANKANVGAGPNSSVLGDVDGDGDLDLLTANASGTVSVRRNNGMGTYSGTQEVALGGAARQVLLADMDGDSNLDLLVVLQSGAVRLLRNEGGATFPTPATTITNSGQGVAVGDLDADGDLDLLITNAVLASADAASGAAAGSTVAQVFANNGLGTFSLRSVVPTGAGINPLPVLADADNDGDLDLFLGSYFTQQALLYRNSGTGTFANLTSLTVGGGGYVDALAVGDIDKDGDLDLLTASYTSSRISVRRNDGTGTYSGSEEVDLQSRGPLTLSLGDVDGDGDLDLLTANQNTSTVGVRRNDGTGTFSGSQEVPLNRQAPGSLALGDVDGNGTLDLVTPHAATNVVSVLLNQSQLRTPENPAGTVAGLDYQYYEDVFTRLPDFNALPPLKAGTVSDFDVLSMRQRDINYALRFTGYLSVPTSGQYTFFIYSDDGSQLRIGSTLVVDNDGQHDNAQERTGTIGLQAGTHALTVTYFQSGGNANLSIGYEGPDGVRHLLPAASLRRIPSLAATQVQEIASANSALVTMAAPLQLSPNPSTGRFTVHYTTSRAQSATLSVSDRLGRQVLEQTVQLHPGENEVVVDAGHPAQGMYQLQLHPALDKPQTQKLVLTP